MRAPTDPGVRAAIIASKLARELGLPMGNMWEPGIARSVEAQLRADEDDKDVEDEFRIRFGLPQESPVPPR